MKSNDMLQGKLPKIILAEMLIIIADNDENHEVRDPLIVNAMSLALQCGYEVGFAAVCLDWMMVMIELPTGQVSWSIPRHTKLWDGFGDTKVLRIVSFAGAVLRGL